MVITPIGQPPKAAGKPDWYYKLARTEIAPLLPTHCGRVLEIGCSSGATLAWLKAEHRATFTAGVEYVPEIAQEAQANVDVALSGDVETMDLSRFFTDPFDLVLCLDVLEHLRDPWGTLRKLVTMLRLGGLAIISLPNARHSTLVKQLVFYGRFEYAPSGIMDRTHLRWFTRKTAIELVEQAGLTINAIDVPYRRRWRVRVKNALTLWLLREFWDYQYLILAHRAP